MLISSAENNLEIDWKFKWIYWAQIFLALGVLASPTVVSLFHIIIIIPANKIAYHGPKIKLSKSSWALLALAGWGLISTVYNFETVIKPRKSFGELKYYLFGVLLIYPLDYFFKRVTPYQIKKILNVFWVILILAFFVGISKAWLQFNPVTMKFGEFQTRSGGFLNYMRYGYGSAFIVILGMSIHLNIAKFEKYLNKKLFYTALVLSLCAIFTSKTRGALLALIVGLPFLYLRYKPVIAKSLIVLGTIALGVIIFLSFFVKGKKSSRFLNINDNSNKMRMSQFYTAVKATQENPILGLGADQFSYNVTKLKHKYDIWSKHYSGHSHNILLEHAANYGIPGVIFLICFLLFWFVEMVKLKSLFGWAIASYVFAFSVSGQVELLFDNANSHILFYVYSMSKALSLSDQRTES
jgi:O-antigen ligase